MRMSLEVFQNATVQVLLELLGSRSCSTPSEMGIAEILAAVALLQLRGTDTKYPPEMYENWTNDRKPITLDKATQTDFIVEPLVPLTRWPLTEILNGGTPAKAAIQETGDMHHMRMSAGPSAVVDECNNSTMIIKNDRTTRRKRTRTYNSESSDQSSYESPQTHLPTKKTCGNNMIRIGDGNAIVPKEVLETIKWDSYTTATRKLLTAIFPRHVLATHSLTGKQSPAFPNKAAKEKLDPKLVNDIVKTVVAKCGVAENIVRTTITTKCADESKMLRNRQRQEEEEDDEE